MTDMSLQSLKLTMCVSVRNRRKLCAQVGANVYASSVQIIIIIIIVIKIKQEVQCHRPPHCTRAHAYSSLFGVCVGEISRRSPLPLKQAPVWAQSTEWLKWGGICNNGVEGAQLSEHHPLRASPAHKATDWRHNAPFSPSSRLLTTWKEVMKERHSQSEEENHFSPGPCDTPAPPTPPHTTPAPPLSLRGLNGIIKRIRGLIESLNVIGRLKVVGNQVMICVWIIQNRLSFAGQWKSDSFTMIDSLTSGLCNFWSVPTDTFLCKPSSDFRTTEND